MPETWLRRHYSPCIMNSYVTSLLCERQKALFCFSFLKIFIAKCCQGVFHGTTFYNPRLEFSTCLRLMKRHTSTELRIPSLYFPGTRPPIMAGWRAPCSCCLVGQDCTTEGAPRTDFSSSSHVLFWHHVLALTCFGGPFTPVTLISSFFVAVIRHPDQKRLVE